MEMAQARVEAKRGLRRSTALALFELLRARFLVALIPFSYWRSGLGIEQAAASSVGITQIDVTSARFWARRVERAARRLPGESKCLPQSIALQRLLHCQGIGSRLVIAAAKAEPGQAREFHAWLEVGGEMVIGQCDPSRYSIVASFDRLG